MSAKQFGITQISCAIVGWCALQGITQEWQEKQWFEYLREVDIKEPPKSSRVSHRKYVSTYYINVIVNLNGVNKGPASA